MEFSALAILNETGERMRRLSLGPGGRVLVETGLQVPSKGMLTAGAFFFDETVVEGDLNSDNQPSTGEVVTDGNVRSLLAAPIVIGGRCQAVISIASSERNAYTDWELMDLDLAMPVLERLVADEISRLALRKREDRTARLSRFVRDMFRHGSLNEVFAEAAGLVVDEVGVDIVRISTPNTGGAFLKTRALVRTRPFGTMVPANGELIVSLMPLHEQVLRNDQTMLSGSDENSTSLVEFEREQAFASGVRSSMIVPISQGGQVLAVVSIASMSNACKLHRDSGALTFVESVARCLVPAIRKFEMDMIERPPEPVVRDIAEVDSKVVARISEAFERRWSGSSGTEDEMIHRYQRIIQRPSSNLEDSLDLEETRS